MRLLPPVFLHQSLDLKLVRTLGLLTDFHHIVGARLHQITEAVLRVGRIIRSSAQRVGLFCLKCDIRQPALIVHLLDTQPRI